MAELWSLGGMARLSRRKKIWILALAGVAVVAVALWFFMSPGRGSPRLFISEPRLTNSFAYFTLTNRHNHPVRLHYTAEKKSDAGWPSTFAAAGTPLLDVSPAIVAPPGQTSMVRVLIPFERVPWRLRIVYCETDTRRDRFIREYGAMMDDVGLGSLANKIAEGEPWYEIYGREMSR